MYCTFVTDAIVKGSHEMSTITFNLSNCKSISFRVRRSQGCSSGHTVVVVVVVLRIVLSKWDFSHGKFGLPSTGKASCDRVALPNLRCMLGILVFPQSTELSHVDYRIFNVDTDVNACYCTQGCTDTVRESALKVDPKKKKIPCRTGESNLRRRRAGPMLYQLSYIPTLMRVRAAILQ